ncbi:MAG: hypothetical protein ABUL41_01215 [Chitinophagaceae bacterium]
MDQKNNILQELNELSSSLATMNNQNLYKVPDGYFEGLVNQVLNRIKAIEAKNVSEELSYLSPMLNKVPRQMPYSIPSGYFEGLENKFMQSVRERSDYQTAQEEIESLSPLLSGLSKQMPYSVPKDYFENLKEIIPTETKVVSIASRKWFRYAAAAVVIGIITLTGFLFITQKSNDPVRSFSKFEKKLDKEIQKTSDKELTEFVQQFTDAGLTGEEKAQSIPKDEVKEMLKDVSDTELNEFIKEIADPEIAKTGGTMN